MWVGTNCRCVPGGGFLEVRAGNSSSSCINSGSEVGWLISTASRGGVDDFSGWEESTPFVTVSVPALKRSLFQGFSGTFSFWATVSTEMGFSVTPGTTMPAGAAALFLCLLFFLPTLVKGGSKFGDWSGGLDIVGDFLFPSLTVSREEISNMVGTERTSCWVRPLPSSSEDRGDGGAFLLFPPFFFMLEDEVERRGSEENGGAGLEDEGAWGEGLFKGVFLDQADLLQAAGLRGCALVTSAGKSSSWNEDFFFVWVE